MPDGTSKPLAHAVGCPQAQLEEVDPLEEVDAEVPPEVPEDEELDDDDDGVEEELDEVEEPLDERESVR